MKHKVICDRKYGFLEIANSGKENKFIRTTKFGGLIKLNYPMEEYIYQFDLEGKVYLDGNLVENASYQWLVNSDWYKVSEIKEESKKESYVSKEDCDKYNKDDFKYKLAEDYIRSICQDEITKHLKQHKLIKDIKDAVDLAEYVIKKGNKVKENKDRLEKIRNNFNKKPKKQKQNFDGENKIWFSLINDKFFLVNSKNKPSILDNWNIATQKEINQFFHGSKKRKIKINKDNSCEWYELNGCNYYRHYGHGIGNDKFVKFDEYKIDKVITEKEYMQGLK